jgi:hypothetical protein
VSGRWPTIGRIRRDAALIGSATAALCDLILEQRPHPLTVDQVVDLFFRNRTRLAWRAEPKTRISRRPRPLPVNKATDGGISHSALQTPVYLGINSQLLLRQPPQNPIRLSLRHQLSPIHLHSKKGHATEAAESLLRTLEESLRVFEKHRQVPARSEAAVTPP